MNKNTILHLIVLLMMLMVGAGNVCGQTDVDYSGTYYIGSVGYNSKTPNSNYYLCPTEEWICYVAPNNYTNPAADNGQPFITTFQCKNPDKIYDLNKAKWTFIKHPTEDYYYIRHNIDGKYLVSNEKISSSNANRIRVHLEETNSPGDKALFSVIPNSTYFAISPKSFSSWYLNVHQGNFDALKGQQASEKNDGPTGYKNVGGTIGLYTDKNDKNAPMYLEGVIPAPEITQQYDITQQDDNTFTITYPGTETVSLYYTTDGSSPDPENAGGTNPTKQYKSPISYQEGISVIKAVAVKAKSGDEVIDTYSSISVFNVIVQLGETHPYLVQSQENSSYYMIPVTDTKDAGNFTKTITTTLGQPSMMWYFKNAGSVDGVQYYYMVNKSTGQYVYYHISDNKYLISINNNETFSAIVEDEDKEPYRFSITPAEGGGFNICPKTNANYCITKSTGNYANGYINASKSKTNALGRWILIRLQEEKMPAPAVSAPIELSTPDQTTHYYSIENVKLTGNYIVMPTSPSTFVTTTNSVTDEGAKWYFFKAAENDWLTYYYIINATTGKYLYLNDTGFLSSTDASAKNVVSTKLFDATAAERYQFVLAPASSPEDATAICGYYIIPKSQVVENTRNYISLYRDDSEDPLKILRRRWWRDTTDGDDAYAKWTFTSAEAPGFLPAPVIVHHDDGSITIVNMANGGNVYYTIDGSDPLSDDGTPSASAIPYNGTSLTLDINVSAIKACAFATDNSKHSYITVFELDQLDAPTISFDNTTNRITIIGTEGSTIFYTTGEDDPTTATTTNGLSPVVISDVTSKTVVKAIAGKAGWKASELVTRTINKVAAPTTETVSGGKIKIASETPAVSIYYVICDEGDASVPTTASTRYTAPIEVESGKIIKAIAVRSGWITSDVGGGVVSLQCANPVIRRGSGNTFTIDCSFPSEGVTIYYTTADVETIPITEANKYTGPVSCSFPVTIKAMAVASGYTNSSVVSKTISQDMDGTGIADDPFLIASAGDFEKFVDKAKEIDGYSAYYRVTDDFTIVGNTDIIDIFTGEFDCNFHTISGLDHALFNTVEGGTVKNVILDDVIVDGEERAGAICNTATGASRIYNCGILEGSSVSGSDYVGGIVGYLDGSSRVINCYSYADITSGDYKGGIVGYNNVASTSGNLQTMVMNCMFYGSISTGGTQIAPVYGGNIIHNKYAADNNTGLNNYCYFLYDEIKRPYVKSINAYHGALGAEERYLNRFEFFRMTLNSTRSMAAYYVSNSVDDKDIIGKWVLDKSIAPYPILKAPNNNYPSIINPDADNAALIIPNDESDRNKGRVLGSLTVKIRLGSGGAYYKNTSATLKETSIIRNITDKDFENFNFNYKKIQLPYYSEVGNGNYTNDRVVTGWKIVEINGSSTGTGNFVNSGTDAPAFNFVDRTCTNKDLFGVSGRVFNQGAYWEVPDGVENITIEPYWAKAVYLSDANYDVTYYGETKYGVTVAGSCRSTVNSQTVYNSVGDAMTALESNSAHTVYDYAVVLVGNYHQYAADAIEKGNNPVTFMSADEDGDCEPDNTLFYRHSARQPVAPIRFDFLNIPGVGMVKRTHDAVDDPEPGIFQPKDWFEVTNTTLIRFGQFEYASAVAKAKSAPLILMGGIYEQFVSTSPAADAVKTPYLLIGGNSWFKNFANGCHTNTFHQTPKVPINVSGGDFENFYLSGIYQPNGDPVDESAECYIDGGRFVEVAGAGMQRIDGNVTWLINAADITHFYGGGINDAQPIKGNISTTISNSHVDEFYGGPKFGDMVDGKTVTTTAADCHFGLFFGAGYGGTSVNRVGCEDATIKANNEPSWSTYLNHYTRSFETTHKTNSGNVTVNAISTSYDYEYILHSDGSQTVARFFVNFASLSLASTRNVTTDLSGCTIGTFYGGGRLGSVNGDVTSTLTSCTVTGNVYGAGFSAEVPTVEVWPIEGLTPVPKYNRKANVFNNASVKTPEPVLYKWDKGHELSTSNPFYDNGDDHFIYTGVDLEGLGEVKGDATLILKSGTTVEGNVFGGGDQGPVGGSVIVNIEGGTVHQSVYGGGALANTNTANAAATPKTTTVNLKGGTINNNVYGGGLGRLEVEAKSEVPAVGTEGEPGYIPGSPAVEHVDAIEALVYGNVLVTLNGTQVVDNGVTTYPDNCVVKGSIFGCNNQNGSPQRDVTVHVHKTVGYEGHMGTPQDKLKSRDENDHSYHLKAVYGGGDLAAYYPQEESVRNTAQTHVIIDGCGQTSIYQVYGGGNAASTPATNVTVNGSYEIEEVFGGGNGRDAIVVNGETISNPGANVGFLDYSETENKTNVTAEELAAAKTNAEYGSGKACVNIYGGTIHAVFGGSNTKGNVREIAVAMLDMDGGCEFDVDEAYGGGKSADMDGEARLEMKCIPKMTTVYGGAMNADVNNDVKLNITNGTFEQVFGGNNMGGRIMGTITVNIEETGCKPIIIGELYGGGNRAPYSIYGYEDSGNTDEDFGKVIWLAKESKEEGGPEYGSPKVNVKSFTSIGDIYGGGYGETAVMVGDPEVNVNVVIGGQTNHDEAAYAGVTKEIDGDIVTIPPHTKGEIGAIQNVFGGGNAAKVVGKPKVNIGTETSVTYETGDKAAHEVIGANIVGNVYGGGNAAEVTGDTNVVIGKKQ